MPNKKSTEVTTQLLAEDGQTIFIGGLIRNTVSKRREGVPYLSDVPYLGKLFGAGEELLIKTETVVLITPHIIHSRFAGPGARERERLDHMHEDLDQRSEIKDELLGGRTSESAPDARPAVAPVAPPSSEHDNGEYVQVAYDDPSGPLTASNCNHDDPALAADTCVSPSKFKARRFFNIFK